MVYAPFATALHELGDHPDKFIIDAIGLIALDVANDPALVFANCMYILDHLHDSRPSKKLSVLYAIDRLSKKAGEPYQAVLRDKLGRAVSDAYCVVPPQIQERIRKMLRTWEDTNLYVDAVQEFNYNLPAISNGSYILSTPVDKRHPNPIGGFEIGAINSGINPPVNIRHDIPGYNHNFPPLSYPPEGGFYPGFYNANANDNMSHGNKYNEDSRFSKNFGVPENNQPDSRFDGYNTPGMVDPYSGPYYGHPPLHSVGSNIPGVPQNFNGPFDGPKQNFPNVKGFPLQGYGPPGAHPPPSQHSTYPHPVVPEEMHGNFGPVQIPPFSQPPVFVPEPEPVPDVHQPQQAPSNLGSGASDSTLPAKEPTKFSAAFKLLNQLKSKSILTAAGTQPPLPPTSSSISPPKSESEVLCRNCQCPISLPMDLLEAGKLEGYHPLLRPAPADVVGEDLKESILKSPLFFLSPQRCPQVNFRQFVAQFNEPGLVKTDDRFSCPKCAFSTTTFSELNSHVLLQHGTTLNNISGFDHAHLKRARPIDFGPRDTPPEGLVAVGHSALLSRDWYKSLQNWEQSVLFGAAVNTEAGTVTGTGEPSTQGKFNIKNCPKNANDEYIVVSGDGKDEILGNGKCSSCGSVIKRVYDDTLSKWTFVNAVKVGERLYDTDCALSL